MPFENVARKQIPKGLAENPLFPTIPDFPFPGQYQTAVQAAGINDPHGEIRIHPEPD